MVWRGRRGPAAQDFLNHGGCLRFIPLQKTVEGFPSSGLLGHKIFKARFCTGNGLYAGEGRGGRSGLKWSREEVMISRTGRGSNIRTSGGGVGGGPRGRSRCIKTDFHKGNIFCSGNPSIDHIHSFCLLTRKRSKYWISKCSPFVYYKISIWFSKM